MTWFVLFLIGHFPSFIENIRTYEGAYLGVQALLSSDFAHKTDSIELWKIPKDRILLDLLSRVIGILPEIEPAIWYIPKHRVMAFRPEILSTDKSINEEDVLIILAQKNDSFRRY